MGKRKAKLTIFSNSPASIEESFLFQIIKIFAKHNFKRQDAGLQNHPWRGKDAAWHQRFCFTEGWVWGTSFDLSPTPSFLEETKYSRQHSSHTRVLHTGIDCFTRYLTHLVREGNLTDPQTKSLIHNSSYETDLQGKSSSGYLSWHHSELGVSLTQMGARRKKILGPSALERQQRGTARSHQTVR